MVEAQCSHMCEGLGSILKLQKNNINKHYMAYEIHKDLISGHSQKPNFSLGKCLPPLQVGVVQSLKLQKLWGITASLRSEGIISR